MWEKCGGIAKASGKVCKRGRLVRHDMTLATKRASAESIAQGSDTLACGKCHYRIKFGMSAVARQWNCGRQMRLGNSAVAWPRSWCEGKAFGTKIGHAWLLARVRPCVGALAGRHMAQAVRQFLCVIVFGSIPCILP
ncbi:hypothetical protein HAX54_031651 [Datura stramonium]|uniref:Uncharacterized protein n=1 Tax=Datura stramonium TaxID=4076 RepID=A0ABS8V9E2_DATST|nr:hypothetical protein [Datura stramonium]